MSSFNKVILLGNLTRDPEVRTTQSGLSICKLGLAVSRKFSTKDGEQREETAFVDIDAFGKPADTISRYLKKGSPLMVEGRLRLDQWETNEGQKRSKLGVVLETFQFIPTGNRGGNDSAGYENSSPPKRESAPSASSGSGDNDSLDDDVPF